MAPEICKVIVQIVLIIIFVKLILYLHVVGAFKKTTCPISQSTVEVVDDCPDNEEKWRVAAERKNCAAYANQCDEPQRLVYHCTTNAFSNQSLEVCAYGKYIFGGYCTVYSLSGNLIVPSHSKRGRKCPNVYNSSDAFKCQGCFYAKTILTEHISLETTTDISAKNITRTEREPADNDFSNENDSQEKLQIASYALVGVILVIVVIVVIICNTFCRCKRCFCVKDVSVSVTVPSEEIIESSL